MASKLGPKFSLLAKGRKDWTSTLTNSDTQVVVETNRGEAFVLEVFSENFHTQLIENSEERWIFLAQIIREDEEILFAFENPRERTLFEELRSIDGIGPKSAALLVGRLGLTGFRSLLENPKNISTVKIPGLGPKNLEKMSLGLKQKKEHFLGIVGQRSIESSDLQETNEILTSDRVDLEKALTQLGLKSHEARDVFAQMCKENPSYQEMALAQLLQETLRWLGRTRSRSELST
jgi:Holliday junction DNA helicase RuvA